MEISAVSGVGDSCDAAGFLFPKYSGKCAEKENRR